MEKFYDNSWALLIGIGEFLSKSISKLKNPVNDIDNMEATLIKCCDYQPSNIIKLKNLDATVLNIKDKIGELNSKVSINDRLIVYYSGHGETRTISGRTPKKTGYLVPYDAKRAGKSLNSNSLMEFDELIRLVHDRTRARQILFIFDCCFSGIAKRDIGDSEFEKPLCMTDLKNAASNNKSVQIITAGGENELILDSGINPDISILNYSVQKFVEQVNPNNFKGGFITARNLAKEINLTVGRRSVLLDKSQTPRFSISPLDGEGEFVFKQFTDEEIHNAKLTSISFHEIENIVLNSPLKTIFTRKNLLTCLEIVEDKLGTEYSLKRLQEVISSIIEEDADIIMTLDKSVKERGLDETKKEELKSYLKDNLISMGLAKFIFKPRFIDAEMEESEERK